MGKVWRSAAEDLADQLGRTQDALVPKSVRMMRDLNKGLVEATRFGGLNQIGKISEAFGKHAMASSLSTITGSMGEGLLKGATAQNKVLTDMFGTTALSSAFRKDELSRIAANMVGFNPHHDRLRGVTSISTAVENITRSMGLSSRLVNAPLFDFIRGLTTLDRQMKALFPSFLPAWTDHVRELALPSMQVVSDTWKNVGMFTVLPEATAASLLWRTPSNMWLAGLFDATGRPEATPIEVDVVVVCIICKRDMTTPKTSFEWVGPRRGVSRAEAVPFCAECLKKERQEPGFIMRALERVDAGLPPLVVRAVFEGGSAGDGVRRGKLELVPFKKTPKKPDGDES